MNVPEAHVLRLIEARHCHLIGVGIEAVPRTLAASDHAAYLTPKGPTSLDAPLECDHLPRRGGRAEAERGGYRRDLACCACR